MTALEFKTVDLDETRELPDDIPPPMDVDTGTRVPFDPEFPDSTPEAPFGYKSNGEPRKRRPNGAGTGTTTVKRSGKANDALASSAAKMLCQVNSLVGMSLAVFGLPQTATDLEKANGQFEVMATEALRSDPVLCKKILSAGQSSGRAGLLMAYIYLGGSAFPAAREEFRTRKAERAAEEAESYA